MSYIEPIIEVVGGREKINVKITNPNQYDDMNIALKTSIKTLTDLVVPKNSSKNFTIASEVGNNVSIIISVNIPDLGGGEYIKYVKVKPIYRPESMSITLGSDNFYSLYFDYIYRSDFFEDFYFNVEFYIDSGSFDEGGFAPDGLSYTGRVRLSTTTGRVNIPINED